ncbi:toll/interleukin-1 receptor domain-containing protein [uncultured Prevotella sp.]|uniref:toll/interleukin-1 receptor domain-containing protein n=1 Tax=uncultured Prevotella sp. TaxID=159272 RepID=UPI0026035338|nr:toll/interleukin-1 receptor domain-containing protein [uncultured Prevotella sp.]
MNKKIIEESATICDNIANAINQRSRGRLNCQMFCPGEDKLISILNKLALEIKDIEPEYFIRLNKELLSLKTPNCVNPFSFGAVITIVSLLKMKYIDNTNKIKKFFISHSTADKDIVNSFIKEILKIGCGFRNEDIFCTLDSTAIRTGDDFRDKIIENMKQCDYILLFISENYNRSDVCKNEMGAAWALEGKRILPFVFPNISFDQMGFLNVVKQGASITDKCKLDEFYQELCKNYDLVPDWITYNKAKEDFISLVNKSDEA